ncbi:hypothetical protein M9H77_31127 [Catharanthus roseus]|uniref:Uncharacterized protein n=1 Tax=Catharanthus roseus TaxID=4058 RepID=A0ACC0A097_CATRO|nr:hypothetical protein M9H77_31127 [Catharanthus roseus]
MQEGSTMSKDGQLPTQSHQEGTSDPTRMNLNETLRFMQQLIEGLARQFYSVARDVEELKRGKSSASMEQIIGDNFGGVNLPHHQRPYNSMSTHGYQDMSANNPYPFHAGGFQVTPQAIAGRRGGQSGRGYYRPHEEVPRHEAWREDNLFENFGEDPYVGQAYYIGYYGTQQGDKALHKIKWKVPSFEDDSDANSTNPHIPKNRRQFSGKTASNHLPR